MLPEHRRRVQFLIGGAFFAITRPISVTAVSVPDGSSRRGARGNVVEHSPKRGVGRPRTLQYRGEGYQESRRVRECGRFGSNLLNWLVVEQSAGFPKHRFAHPIADYHRLCGLLRPAARLTVSPHTSNHSRPVAVPSPGIPVSRSRRTTARRPVSSAIRGYATSCRKAREDGSHGQPLRDSAAVRAIRPQSNVCY